MWCPLEKMGFLTRNALFWGERKWAFLTPKPSFPDFQSFWGFWPHVQGGRIRNTIYGAQNDCTHKTCLGINFPITQDICYTGLSGRNYFV